MKIVVLAGIVAGAVQGAPVNPWGIGESSPQKPPLYEDTRIARETLVQETTTPEPPPTPFKYAFSAGRAPGGKPDRYAQQEGDEFGNIKGSYAYLDPNFQWRQVKYEATKEGGFQIVGGVEPEPVTTTVGGRPVDTVAVQRAKAEHALLFDQIATRNSHPPTPLAAHPPADTLAVSTAKLEHEALRYEIQLQHDRIAAEHARLHKQAADVIQHQS